MTHSDLDQQPPIYRMRNADFAQLVQSTLMPLLGRDNELSEYTQKTGKLKQSHRSRLDEEKMVDSVNDATPPDDPSGAPMSLTHSTIHRKVLQQRKAAGLRTTFTGGVSGAFGDLHGIFIGAGGTYGKLLNLDKIGNDAAQHARIMALEGQWYEHKSIAEREALLSNRSTNPAHATPTPLGYPQQLKEELEALEKVPIKLKVDGKWKAFDVENVQIGDQGACLAHVLYAVGRNALSLSDRPEEEMQFIMQAVSNFSRILHTTDDVHDFLAEELKKHGVKHPNAVLAENHLSFAAERAERIVQQHAPFLKLYDVISPLLDRGEATDLLEPLLVAIGSKCEKTPPIVNAEHGARLLEALHYNMIDGMDRRNGNAIGTTAASAGIDSDALRQELRKSAHERPFDVARLAELPNTKKLLKIAQRLRENPNYINYDEVKRALDTFEHAVSQQKAVGDKREQIVEATGHLSAAREGGKSALVSVIDSGMNHDELARMFDEINQQVFHGKAADKSYTNMIAEQMSTRAARIRNENQTITSL